MDTTRNQGEGAGSSTASRAASSRPSSSNREPSAGRTPDRDRLAGESGSVREKAAAATEDVKARAGEMVDQAKQRATDVVNVQKGRVAQQVCSVAEALREGTKKLQESDANAVAPWAEAAASQIDNVGKYVR